jgi:5S rRNA maturation endonuclease (ribonuclease M5)
VPALDLNEYSSIREEIDQFRLSALKSAIEPRAVELLQYLYPEGQLKSGEFCVGDLSGSPGKSTKIAVKGDKIGVGCDFATNEPFGDLIDIYRKNTGADFVTAVNYLEQWAGIASWDSEKPRVQLVEDKTVYEHIKTLYTYLNDDGSLAVTIERTDIGPDKKFRPIMPNGAGTFPKDFIRPIYNLPDVIESSEVIFVEGEKSADALIEAGECATCIIGGTNAPIEKTDFSGFKGKTVTVWRDNDEAGKAFMDRMKAPLVEAGITAIYTIEPPKEMPAKWDAGDATPDQIKRLLGEKKLTHREINIFADEFSVSELDDNPPPEDYLIEGGFATGSCSMVAALGDAGKSMMLLDMCIKIAYGKHPRMDEAFGGLINKLGNTIYISGEDNRLDIWRRVVGLDTHKRRFNDSKYQMRFIPIPSLGVSFPLLYVKDGQLMEHPNWTEIKRQILSMDDIRAIVCDPMSMLCQADTNADPSISSRVIQHFNQLADQSGASVIVAHHMSKGEYNVPIKSAEQARQHIRGTTGLVDSVRQAVAIWKAPEEKAKQKCREMGIDYSDDAIFYAAVCKSNYKADRSVKMYARNSDNGLLECVSDNVDLEDLQNEGLVEDLFVAFAIDQASRMQPLKVDRDHVDRMVPAFCQEIRAYANVKGDHALRNLGNRMVTQGRLKLDYALKGGGGMCALYPPDGHENSS